MWLKPILFSVTALALVACDQAATSAREDAVFRARNGFLVHPLGDGSFEVIPRGASGGRSFFCAAADYAQRRLGAPPSDRVVLVAPVGPAINNPGGRSAKFRVAPSGSGSRSSIALNMRRPGESVSIGHGRTLCNRDLPGFFPD